MDPLMGGAVETLQIIVGLIAGGYRGELIGKYIRECVDLKQDDLLEARRHDGISYLTRVMPNNEYTALVEYLAGAYQEEDAADERTGSSSGQTGSSPETAVEVARELPEEAKAPSRRTARKKASGAADGK